ncbi:efflux RND transporter periplasmic adaptor subunit [Thiomicrorhabdus chilensis]|uniref:efflux RND transporter periplasmic adaptor subunit n=1 Tax=Thiomicrorhabdus chilensis TaxID=63656 RepID=UPI00040ADCEB|nr:efflux RND transporter periplasmic adaptor subunit [Thiomicrorhabdus chilensis]
MFPVSQSLVKLSALLLIAAASVFPVQVYADGEQNSAAKQAMPVKVMIAKRGDSPVFYEYPGRIQAVQTVGVFARVAGVLQEKFYEDGQVVKAGQPLYQIDARRYQAVVDKAKAQLQVEQANLSQAKREYNRVKGLYFKKAVSEQERDTAISSLELAKAAVQGAKAALNDAQIDLDYSHVKAEISGVTGIKQQDVGSLVGTDSQNSLLTTITDLSSVYVIYAMPDSQRQALRSLMRQGKLVKAKENRLIAQIIDEQQQVLAEGEVDFTDSRIDETTGSVQARAVFANQQGQFLPGEFVRLRVLSATRKNVFEIPQKAVLQMGQQAFVYVVKQGVAELMPVGLAAQQGESWLVESGLQEGDQVVVNNLIKLRPKTPVKAITANTSGQSDSEAQ